MKKAILTAVILLLAITGGYYLVYYHGLFLDFQDKPEEISADFTTSGSSILVAGEVTSPIDIKCVDITGFLPGHYVTDFEADEEDYYRWMSNISDMGANSVRIYTIMDDEFYNALYRYNSENEEPLYLLQGLWVTDYANNSSQNAYNDEFFPALMHDAAAAVDVIHGKRNIIANRTRGSGIYRNDISKWVIGYIVGLEWNSGTIAYTDNDSSVMSGFDGNYVMTADGASKFETLLSRVMDRLLTYESAKYGKQRLVSFINERSNDPFEYEWKYAKQLGKYNCVDAENILMKEGVESGCFATYWLYDFNSSYSEYFSEAQKAELAHILPELDRSQYWEDYTRLISRYHTIPVMVTYGFSSARGIESESDLNFGPLTEAQQGERLVAAYRQIKEDGCAGAVLMQWQDTWGTRSWNTAYAVDPATAPRWSDVQTNAQGFGLIAFDPGDSDVICHVDGNPSEWSDIDVTARNGDLTLSFMHDERYLYLMAQCEGSLEQEDIYIPIDVTPKTGSTMCSEPALSFSRAADFLICLKGPDESRVLVHERYDSLRENFLSSTRGEDPFITYPDADSQVFVPIEMIVKGYSVIEGEMSLADYNTARLSKTFETGKLTYGITNPKSQYYNSQADFCCYYSCVEVRIPWQMLNFSDPSSLRIHDDYYLNYGVENIQADSIYIGIGTSSDNTTEAGASETVGDTSWLAAVSPASLTNVIQMSEAETDAWIAGISWHERLKQSYDIVKSEWTQQN